MLIMPLKAQQADVAQSGVPGRVDWLVAVQVSPEAAQKAP
jgi:hypothetical protein